MKKPLTIDPSVLARLRAIPRNQQADCWLALSDLCEAFGRPHVHTGLGIRKLAPKLFECRAGIALRFVFADREDCLFVCFLGNHDEVRVFLKTTR